MKRDYISSNNVTGVTYFTGIEIEHSPAYGKDTLFVVGTQDPEEVLEIATNEGVEHIYLGANQSFNLTEEKLWNNLIETLCQEGFWVTLDFELEHLEWVQDQDYTEHNKFIPMISVKVPYIEDLGYNACIKIDDQDFNATNKGVWTHRVHDLMDRNRFTQWDQYKSDKIIE